MNINEVDKYNTIIHNINEYNRNKIYIKREDLLPISFGGNKVRISLQYIKDMMNKKYDVIIGYGNSRSNLCRVLSNISYMYSIPCYIVSPSDDDGSRIETNNSLMVNACEAKYIYCDKTNVADTIVSLIKSLELQGKKPYYINGDKYGNGNEATAVTAYYNVYNEINRQEEMLNVKFDYIFLPIGTGMTYTGLLAGQISKKDDKKIVGISIARKKSIVIEQVKKYLKGFFCHNLDDETINKYICVTDKYFTGGYGKYNEHITNTSKELYIDEGIYADLTYVAKAFYGMKMYIKENEIFGKNILFIHTGSSPLFFDNINEILR